MTQKIEEYSAQARASHPGKSKSILTLGLHPCGLKWCQQGPSEDPWLQQMDELKQCPQSRYPIFRGYEKGRVWGESWKGDNTGGAEQTDHRNEGTEKESVGGH